MLLSSLATTFYDHLGDLLSLMIPSFKSILTLPEIKSSSYDLNFLDFDATGFTFGDIFGNKFWAVTMA